MQKYQILKKKFTTSDFNKFKSEIIDTKIKKKKTSQ